ncbi:MAG: hypothetical protein RLZZ230_366 [Candidatus Parcubacteria bacterium]|jgi:uncharacterized membrane protein YphA (DoxX/SURF4 family)
MFKFLPALFLSVIPTLAFAHTRWFAEDDLDSFQTTEPTTLYLSVCAVIILIIVTVGIWLHQNNHLRLKFLRPKKAHAFERAASTFTAVTGAFFLIAGTHEYLFSPNFTESIGVPEYLIVMQILIGIMFLVGIFTRTSAIVLGLMWLVSFFYVEWVEVIENIWVLSTAMFIAVMGNDYFSLISFSRPRKYLRKYRNHALSFLRVGTGSALMILGFSEKILEPEYGINFLSHYHWNFAHYFGVNMSDYLFTISAGSVEFTLGLVFVLGIMTRLNALVVSIIFTIPLFILGPIELAGHIPHFASVILLLFFGGGGFFTMFRKHKDEKIF